MVSTKLQQAMNLHETLKGESLGLFRPIDVDFIPSHATVSINVDANVVMGLREKFGEEFDNRFGKHILDAIESRSIDHDRIDLELSLRELSTLSSSLATNTRTSHQDIPSG